MIYGSHHNSSQSSTDLPCITKHAVICIFSKELQLHQSLRQIIKKMEVRYEFSLRAIFELIAHRQMDVITPYCVEQFLKIQNYHVSKQDLRGIISRIDTTGDCQITFDEWATFFEIYLTPKAFAHRLVHLGMSSHGQNNSSSQHLHLHNATLTIPSVKSSHHVHPATQYPPASNHNLNSTINSTNTGFEYQSPPIQLYLSKHHSYRNSSVPPSAKPLMQTLNLTNHSPARRGRLPVPM